MPKQLLHLFCYENVVSTYSLYYKFIYCKENFNSAVQHYRYSSSSYVRHCTYMAEITSFSCLTV